MPSCRVYPSRHPTSLEIAATFPVCSHYGQGFAPRDPSTSFGTTTTRLQNTNTNTTIDTTFVADKRTAKVRLILDHNVGVPGKASQITLESISLGSARMGKLLPTGNPLDYVSTHCHDFSRRRNKFHRLKVLAVSRCGTCSSNIITCRISFQTVSDVVCASVFTPLRPSFYSPVPFQSWSLDLEPHYVMCATAGAARFASGSFISHPHNR
ncbi:hypothetical protein M405DRAFT_547943 [Rhizopogon salebrosus TDB-379]|nr:hypothetical protein M405DRAFT_547943 [Rhizopogon salebrosus TDB-379]